MTDQWERTRIILGEDGLGRLKKARVAVFGIGGVGGFVCEALVRGGIGEFDLIDKDVVDLTNLNRQIIATHSTIGRYKCDVMKERMEDIHPDVVVHCHNTFFLPETADQFDWDSYDYVVDAVDTVTAKIELILRCKEHSVPVISSMGTGNKLHPELFQIADLYETDVCPLAKVMRRELKKRGVDSLKVVYSKEKPVTKRAESRDEEARKVVGSISFSPSVAGLLLAGEVIRDLAKLS